MYRLSLLAVHSILIYLLVIPNHIENEHVMRFLCQVTDLLKLVTYTFSGTNCSMAVLGYTTEYTQAAHSKIIPMSMLYDSFFLASNMSSSTTVQGSLLTSIVIEVRFSSIYV